MHFRGWINCQCTMIVKLKTKFRMFLKCIDITVLADKEENISLYCKMLHLENSLIPSLGADPMSPFHHILYIYALNHLSAHPHLTSNQSFNKTFFDSSCSIANRVYLVLEWEKQVCGSLNGSPSVER